LASVILLYGINTFYLIIVRNYFENIPKSLEEAAKIDGANDIVILFKIFLPLSLPILATFLLFYSVDRWNEWFYSMLFINDGRKWPLQVALRNIIMSSYVSEFQSGNGALKTKVFGDSVKMASVVVTMGPIMIVYPFLQKYFTKGLLVGAVKG
jgi:putative aldouronate transport system permease protein